MSGALLGITRDRTADEDASLQMKALECGAVLFDLDGVLVDSVRYIEEQWRRWALGKGLSPDPFLRVCHGRRALETIQLAAPQLNAEAEIAAFVPDEAVPQLLPIEGAERLLRILPAAGWAVATSGSRATATGRLLGAGLPIPRVLVCAEDVLHGKPSPDVYLTAAVRLGVDPADCIVVEDAPAGIQAAHTAGMRVIALTTTHRREDLAAEICARSLADISLGRVEHRADGALQMEMLVAET
jgi:mannitol-1-/sugar-/sorbitol-6-phosphatase